MRILANVSIASIAASCLFSANVSAECQGSQNLPPQQFFIAFSKNSHEIPEAERAIIGRWISTINSNYPIQNWIDIIGSASKAETAFDQLSRKRASETAKVVIDNGLINAPLQIKTQIYPANGTSEPSPDSREVIVQVSPGCPGNCCTSP
ncbi:OmpA family protein [Burkholderia contaminans]|uniref:OmpA family protein n=1 Tax=Burkholderia contaminans TaxID=488447 RepID=UPI000F57C852|nr:OmpA family protein [Burkholderia contaminans]RQT40352.1 hypothetical protein DF036_01665 [Burkholderia contaminans]